ncbi:BatD family protein [Salegentibacter sp. F188]|uniref:BatD family protein n=1 Tax=Autumnicola patrickiae TaxID=3075591 RepID=A0ABU3E5J0_9FLAO|nr:BatD family protein [Salegentibacter sp. F188]MDT0691268.1 BatD family protein [Salegentibacter sp. F188]
MKLKLIFISLFLVTANFLQAQVRFEASVSKEKLGINERLRVDFEMNQDGDNFRPPSFNGFRVIGGPNQSVSRSIVNGRASYSKTYTYFLQPESRGNITIGQAEIEVDDKIYKTSPIDIEVTAAVDESTAGSDSDIVASENLHLVAEISNPNPYLNEAITVVYKLYVSPSISVSNWREIDNPKFSDFWSQNIDIRQLRAENGEYKGQPYRFVVLRKTVLYPQKTGELDIEPLALSVSVDVPSERRDIFGSRIYRTVQKTVAAGSRTINVKPLPQAGRPADFTGAVGDFDFEVTTSKDTLDASESLRATVEVRGNGNLKLFDLPDLSVPASLEIYEPERSENVNTNLNGMQGSISENYTIVPTRKGKYPIPALGFSYFDLDTETYKTITSKEILLNVEEGPALETGTPGGTSNRQAVTTSGDQFRYIKLNANLRPLQQQEFFKSVPFWGMVFLPVLIIPLVIFFGKKREAIANDETGNRRKRADKLARKYLSEAKKNLGDQAAFYVALEKAMHNYLKAKLHIQTSEMSKDRIREVLAAKGADPGSIDDFISLLESCEFARYTPASSVAMKQDYEKAAAVISTLDKQI